MKYLILGLGKSGQAAYELLVSKNLSVTGTDNNYSILEEWIRLGKKGDFSPNIDHFDLIIVSPGISPKHPLYQQALLKNKTIIGELELGLGYLKHNRFIGITGTNGKTTVTLLVEHILNSAGHCAKALGNVGTPLSAYTNHCSKHEILITELSSYQLETIVTACFDIGVILNITPDHLDRYPSMTEYAFAKCRIQHLIKNQNSFYVHESVALNYSSLLQTSYLTYGINPSSTYWTDKIFLRKGNSIEISLPKSYQDLGRHESENVLAAWLICSYWGVQAQQFEKALETFQKPPHRIEFVAKLHDITYFNDSKGTNIDATIKAVESIPYSVILIVGGVDKGSSYMPWKVFGGKVRWMIAFGQAAKKIEEELRDTFSIEIVDNLEKAVFQAKRKAIRGECILLSPGCASFDMFRSYAHRGEEFKRYVLEERSQGE